MRLPARNLKRNPHGEPQPQSIAVLDLGTSHLTLLQVQIVEGELRYRGHVTAPSQGLRKGAVVSLTAAADAIRSAAAALESQTSLPVETVFLICTGVQVRGLSSEAGVALTSRSREVTRDDARRVLDLARDIPLPDDRQIIHVIPQEFVLDRQGGIHEPVGMLASRLQAKIYAITVATALKDNLVLACNHAGLAVDEIIFAPLASAEACLAAEDRFSGVALADFGAGSTSLLLYAQGSLQHAAVIPIGGDHFTNDVASGLSASQSEAERIKVEYGSINAREVAANSLVEAADGRSIPQRQLCEWIEARAQELASRLQTELAKAAPLGSGLLCTGGAINLQGLADLVARSAGLTLRTAAPATIEGMPSALATHEFAPAVGACFYAHRLLTRREQRATPMERLRAFWSSLSD